MSVSDELITQFVKATYDSKQDNTETTHYGTVVEDGSQLYVRLDGSDVLTPILTTTEIQPGERVVVTIRNHTATVMGNLDNPAFGTKSAGSLSSTIEQTAEAIRSEVSNGDAQLKSQIEQTAESIRSEVADGDAQLKSQIEQTAEAIRSEVSNGDSGLQSKITQQAESITTLVQNQNEFSKFQQTVNEFSFMSNGGTVKIKGGDIELTGAIKFSDLSDASTVQKSINSALSAAKDAQDTAGSALSAAKDAQDAADIVEGWTYKDTTYIDGTQLMTGTVSASTIRAGDVQLLDDDESLAGYIYLTGAASYNGGKVVVSSGAIELNAGEGDIYLENGSEDKQYLHLDSANDLIVIGNGDVAPNVNNSYSCGISGHVWTDIYSANQTIQTSDRNRKKDIIYGLEQFDKFFYDLKVCSFLFKDGTSGRRHPGLIAQDVEENLFAHDLTSMDFAGLIKSPKKDENKNVVEGEYEYGLRYGEFIPLCIDQLQKQKQEINELKNVVSELKSMLEEMRN